MSLFIKLATILAITTTIIVPTAITGSVSPVLGVFAALELTVSPPLLVTSPSVTVTFDPLVVPLPLSVVPTTTVVPGEGTTAVPG